ncbi:calnexin isoform X2 [Palaemon carinicauda]|uniref:calnexin isoform X2 n=1 Tax=Palaemon carinicauda TaxID=392227 RepID=UPI0035B5CB0D
MSKSQSRTPVRGWTRPSSSVEILSSAPGIEMAVKWKVKSFLLLALLGMLLPGSVFCDDGEEVTISEEPIESEDGDDFEVVYVSPKPIPSAYLMETFDDESSFDKVWVRSEAKKGGVDEDIAKYDGVWSVEAQERLALSGDQGLALKSKAKHAAISAPLKKPFVFSSKPFVVQYEVNLQNGQECGGAYIKLLSSQNGKVDLKNFHDKTPYTIMFGPDKCGNEFKLHFIFRHVNPLNGEIEEKHAKRPRDKIEEPFKDKKPHLYTLILRPDNSYEILLDHEVVNSGNLLEDFTPPVNPPKEIDDPEDFMPEDWDEREKIPDPEAVKPEDWDEEAPMQIPDPEALKPRGWLDSEPEMIPDPAAEKPEDWDDEMDGEWEAPLINNPICTEVPGCGEWKPPMIDNPDYKGKWRPEMIDNPNYRGKWKPRKIHNPDYFEDLEPFKMTPIGAVGIELWSMSDNILFDNIIVTDNVADAVQFAQDTFDLKVMKMEKGQGGLIQRIINYSNKHPWLYAVYTLLVAIPVVLIFACCCAESKDSKEDKEAALRKKTDEPTEDDPVPEGAEDGNDDKEAGDDEGAAGLSEGEKEGEEDRDEDEDDEDAEDDEEDKPEKDDVPTRTSPRLRKSRKD